RAEPPRRAGRAVHDPGLYRLARVREARRHLLRLHPREDAQGPQLHEPLPRARRAHPDRRLRLGLPGAGRPGARLLSARPGLIAVRARTTDAQSGAIDTLSRTRRREGRPMEGEGSAHLAASPTIVEP